MLTPVVRRNRTVFTRCNWFSGHVDAWCYWPTARLISIQQQHTNTFTCQTLAHLHTHKHIHYSHICWCVDGWLLSSQQASLVVLKRGSWGILITLYSQTAEADVVLARCINTPPHRDDGKHVVPRKGRKMDAMHKNCSLSLPPSDFKALGSSFFFSPKNSADLMFWWWCFTAL